ncbi:hypothetical protein [Streptomyces sp. NPDC005907]|uniref:hypothetical protein n=1 Tax=Streptomyces sp. NPDC005907 TaxID=3154571 RepID=UPI0033EA09DB
MGTRLAAMLCGVALTAGTLLSAPAATAQASAYPTSKFDVTVGNTFTRGTITWYARSVTLTGVHRSVDVDYCRGTSAFTLTSRNAELGRGFSDERVCGTSREFTLPVEADVQGGAAVVRVCLDDGGAPDNITYYKCERYGRP